MDNHAGFTGTQRGMNLRQMVALRLMLQTLLTDGCTNFHHGDCIGADAEAHTIANELGYVIEIHPPEDGKKRANMARFATVHPIIMHECKPYLVRNHDIVDACAHMLAAPLETTEQLRSGTWSTVRYARRAGCRLYLLEREVL